MDVGISYPMMLDTERHQENFLMWCKAAEDSSLASVALGERISYECQDAMTSLAFAAGTTRRLRLLTSVLALPAHPTALMAKQAATLDILSGGRFSLGVGMSSRPQDFSCLGLPYKGRSAVFEGQLQELKSLWRGEPADDNGSVIGPAPLTPGGPPLIVGAIVDAAFERAGRLADGVMSWSFSPDAGTQRRQIELTQQARTAAGRAGAPKFIAAIYFSLGDQAEKRLSDYLHNYYGYSPLLLELIKSVTTFTPKAIRETIESYRDAGVDELIFSAADTDVDSVKRLADVVGGE